MFIHETTIRVRYSETDQMGYVYYGNYAAYLEVARVEAMKSLGVSYKNLEEQGVIMPVLYYETKYYKPAFYDDDLKIKTIIHELPKTRISFLFEIYNLKKIKLNTSKVILAFVNLKTKKPGKAPAQLIKKLQKHF